MAESYEQRVARETLIFEATEEICRVMGPDQDSGEVTRKELAERLGKSKGFVTQVLGGERNMTLRTLADFAGALGHKVTIRLEPVPGPPGEKAASLDDLAGTVSVHRFPEVGGDWVPLDEARAAYRALEAEQPHPALSKEQRERLNEIADELDPPVRLPGPVPFKSEVDAAAFLRSLATEGETDG